ncbi:MAG: Gfo/Idh/MocA family oxidoreductase [Kiritimatiellae bacterium]|nr:Gfo/Idh/MocA family oxidoreductase [Kiritimatiellia bacterium]
MRGALAAGAFPLLPGCFSAKKYLANSKVRLAGCGVGGMGGEGIRQLFATGLCDVVALCDTDLGASHTQKNLKKFPKAARFHDFREMFDKMADGFDACTAGVPDHSHFPIAMRAMKEGKAIYSEKPLGHAFHEIQVMIDAAEKYGAVTQMGNQGHSCDSYYQMRDYVKNGVIDPNKVKKIETHMNYPRRWHKWNGKVDRIPVTTCPRPETMSEKDWTTWLGTVADDLPFSKDLAYGEWRSWYKLGNGCLGDWGAHIMDGIHEFFELGLPTEIVVSDVSGWNKFVFPMKDTLTFKFAATTKRKALDVVWREGIGNLPELPKGFCVKSGDGSIPKSGGQSFDKLKEIRPGKEIWMEDGVVWQGCSHNDPLIMSGAADAQIPDWECRGGGCNWPNQHYENFLRAVRGEIKTTSPFAVAGPLSQVFTLGCIAQRLNRSLKFDPVKKEFIGDAEANALLSPVPRKGWEEYYRV